LEGVPQLSPIIAQVVGVQIQVPGVPAVVELHVVKVGLPSGGQVPQECPQESLLQLSAPHVLGQVQALILVEVVPKGYALETLSVLLKQQFLLKRGTVMSVELIVSQPTS
jgi:hypothetical protein